MDRPDLEWLEIAACADKPTSDYFVEAGCIISDAALNTCRSCPVRRECITHAYTQDHTDGYFGGMSPGARRSMDLDDAIKWADADTDGMPRRLKILPAPPFVDDELTDFEYR